MLFQSTWSEYKSEIRKGGERATEVLKLEISMIYSIDLKLTEQIKNKFKNYSVNLTRQKIKSVHNCLGVLYNDGIFFVGKGASSWKKIYI